ncbi:hypothetical protein R1flu_023766 [Riccia fluitans]|uniref:Uncharacterized protein n=1 Tax=Riccia fluitans TaxID=41844 RepID=A0ABD1XTG5_9MARC
MVVGRSLARCYAVGCLRSLGCRSLRVITGWLGPSPKSTPNAQTATGQPLNTPGPGRSSLQQFSTWNVSVWLPFYGVVPAYKIRHESGFVAGVGGGRKALPMAIRMTRPCRQDSYGGRELVRFWSFGIQPRRDPPLDLISLARGWVGWIHTGCQLQAFGIGRGIGEVAARIVSLPSYTSRFLVFSFA